MVGRRGARTLHRGNLKRTMIYAVEDSYEGSRQRSSGVALEAALDLSDGTSSIVVLQGGDGAWAAFLPSVLVGQRSVFMLRQQPTESLQELLTRVGQRLNHADYPMHRLLWVTPPDTSDALLDILRPSLVNFCDAQREVLLVSGERVELMAAEPELEDLVCSESGEHASGEMPAVAAPEYSDVVWDSPEHVHDLLRDSVPPRSA